jgi:hypothetical protein
VDRPVEWLVQPIGGGIAMSRGKLRPKVVPVVVPSAEARMLEQFMALVGSAAASFEARWSLRALQWMDPELHALLVEQQLLYHETLITGEMKI